MASLPKSLPRRQTRLKAPQASVSASEAKTHLLQLLDKVDRTREGLIITKRGRPVAKLVPMETEPAKSIFGCMKGTFRIAGDIVGAEPDVWEAML
jgi:prevent-host-death family protein